MADRIDVMTPDIADCPQFTVDTTGPLSVIVTQSVNIIMRGGNGNFPSFQRGDNFSVLSAGYVIPERFAIYQFGVSAENFCCPVMDIAGYRLTSLDYIPLFPLTGNGGWLKLPLPNYELCLGAWIDAEDLMAEAFQLRMTFPAAGGGLTPMEISMVNVPAVLNGQVFRIVPFLKVVHNLAMTV